MAARYALVKNTSMEVKDELLERFGQECFDRHMHYVPDGKYKLPSCSVVVKFGEIFVKERLK